jgi:hypothetical protein
LTWQATPGRLNSGDYATLRLELLLYNAEYMRRLHILCLNNMDIEWAALRTEELNAGDGRTTM